MSNRTPAEQSRIDKSRNIEAALLLEKRNRMEAKFEMECEREGAAIRRSNFFRPHRPRRPAGFMPPVAAQGR